MDEASERVDISSLPYVLCVQILAELRSMRDTMRCRRLSRRWKELASDEALWQQLCARHFALTERVAPSFGPVRNEPERLISQRVVVEGVAGAPELIGRGVGIVRGVDGDKCLVHFLDAAGDVWVDVSRLAPADELAAAAVTDMEPCASYVEAAYKWSRLRQALGLETAAAHHLAPHWSQASLAWRQLEAWAFKVSPDLRASFNGAAKPGAWRHFVEELQLSPSDESQLLGLQLLSAIHNGQHFSSDMELALSNGVIEQASGDDTEPVPHTVRTQQATLGLIGGYAAYSELASTRLYPLELVAGWTRFFRDQLPHTHGYIVAAASFNLRKFFCVDLLTGELRVGPVAMARRGRPSLPETTLAAVPRESAQQHETTPALRCQLVKWLWQLSDRLTNGMYSFEKLIPMQPASIGVSLFPRTGSRASEAVTRGIRVRASAVFAPEQECVIYSIRMKLLDPATEGGLSKEERGFETAQLRGRHWVITAANGAEDHVRGDGVVGLYPLLKEGGWRHDHQNSGGGARFSQHVEVGADCEGEFVYQSMTNPAATFSGELIFVPGSLRKPTGEEFNVHVAPFPIASGQNDYIY